jgi:hypothetical protein
MKKSRFTEEQIAFALRQHDGGTAIGEIVRKLDWRVDDCRSVRSSRRR